MKHYTYNSSHYMIQMTIPGIFTLLIGLYSLYKFIFSGFYFLWLLIAAVCVYNVWNTFVSISNPSEIVVADSTLTFMAYKGSHVYETDKIEKFAMRPVAGGERLYVMINNGGILRGRYWIRLPEFNDSKELNDYFYKLDAKVNPNSVFTTARKQGRERQKKV